MIRILSKNVTNERRTNLKLKTITILACALSLGGCATMKDSLLLGAGAGGTLGGTIGLNASRGNASATILGMAVGAVVGVGMGYLAHESDKKPKVEKRKPEIRKDHPILSNPNVEMIWVPDQINGDRYVEKHRVWILKQNTHWRKR